MTSKVQSMKAEEKKKPPSPYLWQRSHHEDTGNTLQEKKKTDVTFTIILQLWHKMLPDGHAIAILLKGSSLLCTSDIIFNGIFTPIYIQQLPLNQRNITCPKDIWNNFSLPAYICTALFCMNNLTRYFQGEKRDTLNGEKKKRLVKTIFKYLLSFCL